MTGLSGSGKSSIAIELEKALFEKEYFCQVLDGDNVRMGLCQDLGFSLEDRTENIRRIAEVARLYCQSGIIVVCTFVSPTREIREVARRIIGDEDFVEVYVDTSVEDCENRDVKGLYQKARRGEIAEFTGVSSPYEPPDNPEVVVTTRNKTVQQSTEYLMSQVLPRIGKK